MDSLKVRQLIIVGINAEAEEQASVTAVDYLVVAELIRRTPTDQRDQPSKRHVSTSAISKGYIVALRAILTSTKLL